MSIQEILKSAVIGLLMTSLGLSQSVRESFDYTPGSLEGCGDATDGWGGPWTIFEGSPDLMNIEEGSLESSGVPTSGNSLWGTMSVSNDNQRAYRELENVWPDDGTPYWISYLMEVNNVSSNDQSWQGVSLYLEDGTELVLFGKVWGQPNLGLMAHTLGGGATVSPLTWEVGLVWTVIRIDMSGDERNERCFMWFNPSPASEPDTTIADVRADLKLNDGFKRVVVHFGKFLELETNFDELRLGTSFKDVSLPYTSTSVSQHENQLPNQFELSNNYPNPFNPTTVMNYELPVRSRVSLKVYDILGREISELADGIKEQGHYSAIFDGSNFPAGTYFVRMHAARENGGASLAKTIKMLLVK
jgi:hypothetical protein